MLPAHYWTELNPCGWALAKPCIQLFLIHLSDVLYTPFKLIDLTLTKDWQKYFSTRLQEVKEQGFKALGNGHK